MTGTDAAEGMAGWLVARAVAVQSAFDDGHSLRAPFFSGTGFLLAGHIMIMTTEKVIYLTGILSQSD